MAKGLEGKRIAIVVANGFEQVEMTEPKKALEAAGAHVDIVSPELDKVKGWQHTNWGDEFPIDVLLSEANVNDYDALFLPGGVMNPDKLRMDSVAIDFIKQFYSAGKPIAAICHGSLPLINADVVKGHQLTSWPSIRVDLINAGADWVDEAVVMDRSFVTSRKPDDIPVFTEAMIKFFSAKN